MLGIQIMKSKAPPNDPIQNIKSLLRSRVKNRVAGNVLRMWKQSIQLLIRLVTGNFFSMEITQEPLRRR